jgi:hypothetical protein
MTTTKSKSGAVSAQQYQALFNEALNNPGLMSDCYSRFREYSIGNTILAYMQAGPQPIATYKQWQALGRQVKKGAMGLCLLTPVTIKTSDDDDASDMRTFFKLSYRWFKLSDTDGEPLSDTREPIDWNLDRALTGLGIARLDEFRTGFNCQGYASKRGIAISPVAKYPIKTGIHEMAHILLGHLDKVDDMSDGLELAPSVQEVEAESVAYLVCASLGLDYMLAESRGYIQSWARAGKSSDTVRVNKVFAVADKILKSGRGILSTAKGAA